MSYHPAAQVGFDEYHSEKQHGNLNDGAEDNVHMKLVGASSQ